jgi:photosynthetic reaction center H subunit
MNPIGAITQYIDVTQLVLYAFWVFFGSLVIYLARESKREGYPLYTENPNDPDTGLVNMPAPKTYLVAHGDPVVQPHPSRDDHRPVAARPVAPWMGAPLVPTGNPLVDGVGPAAWAMRLPEPELTLDGRIKVVPLRIAPDCWLEASSPDARGMPVIAADGEIAGTVQDIWVDRSETMVRYYEVEVPTADGANRRVLLPSNCTRIRGRTGPVRVVAITAAQFRDVPATAHPEQVTVREEDRIMAYYAGGYLYATPSRQEPLL